MFDLMLLVPIPQSDLNEALRLDRLLDRFIYAAGYCQEAEARLGG